MNMRGRWHQQNKKALVDDYWSLDMATIAKRIDLEAPKSYVWLWTSTGSGDIRRHLISFVVIPGHGLYLRCRQNGEYIDTYLLPVVTTRPNFGGKRYWFLCPTHDCRRRVRILYGNKRFLCRHCHNLVYETAQSGGDLVSRIDSRLGLLRRKLSGTGHRLDAPLDKPPNMHLRTHMRLISEYYHLLLMRVRALTYDTDHLLQVNEHNGDLPTTPKTRKDDLMQEWKAYKKEADQISLQ